MEMDNKDQISLMEKVIGVNVHVKSYKLLIKAPNIPEKTKGGIIRLVDESGSKDYNVGRVIGMGSQAYKDVGSIVRFPDGPLCKLGDWIAYSPYERYEIKINGHRCFVIADERVDLVIPDESIGSIIVEIDQEEHGRV